MKNKRTIIIVLAALLFLSVIILTNDGVQEAVPNYNIFLIGCILGLASLLYIVNRYPIKNMVDIDMQKEDTIKKTTLKSSIVISLVLFLYSFIFVGSSISSNTELFMIIDKSITFIAIFVGVYLFYINFYVTYIHRKTRKLFFLLITVFINIISLAYFIFVCFWTIADLL